MKENRDPWNNEKSSILTIMNSTSQWFNQLKKADLIEKVNGECGDEERSSNLFPVFELDVDHGIQVGLLDLGVLGPDDLATRVHAHRRLVSP